MSRKEVARRCGFGDTYYFFKVYLPKNYPDVLKQMYKMGYNDTMRIFPPKLASFIIKQFIAD